MAWLLHELAPEVSFEIKPVDLYRGEQFDTVFKDRFPLHAVPAVEIHLEGRPAITMTESGAIIVALADAVPSRALAPPSGPLSPERARYLQIIHACGASFDMHLWQIRIHTHVLEAAQKDERTVARYTAKFRGEVEPLLLERLQRADFICGDGFSAADCMTGHLVMWARTYGLCADSAFRAYLSRLSKRPAFLRAFADAGGFNPVVPDDAELRRRFTG